MPAGPGNTNTQLDIMQKLRVTGYVGMPSYFMHLAQKAEERGLSIKELIRTNQAQGLIEDAIVPTEKVVELVKGQKKTSTRKFYPGYVLVKMIFNDTTWHIIQNIPKVTGFIGGKNRPTPLSAKEAEKILSTIEDRKE